MFASSVNSVKRSPWKTYFALLTPLVGYVSWLAAAVGTRPNLWWAFLLLLWAMGAAFLAWYLARGGAIKLCASLERHAGHVAFSIIAVATLIFVGVSIIQTHYFTVGAQAEDTAYYSQVLWNTLHGNFLAGNVQQARLYVPPVSSDLALHVSPFLVFGLLPIYAIAPHCLTLLIIRDVMLAAAAWPLFLLARERMGGTAGVAAVLLYLLNPTVISQSCEAFYLLQLAPLPFFWAFRAFVREELGHFLLWIGIAISMREDVAITVAGFGLWALVQGRQWHWVGIGFGLPVVWWGLATVGIQPAFGRTADVTLAGVHQTPVDILQKLRNPWWLLETFRAGGLDYVYHLLRPVAFLGVLGWEGLLVVPGLAATLFLGQIMAYGIDPLSRFALLSSCALIGTTVVIVSRFGQKHHWDMRVLAVLMFCLLPSVNLIAGAKEAVRTRLSLYTVYNDPTALREAIQHIPATASVAAPNYALPALSQRPKLFYITYLHMYPEAHPDYVLLDRNLNRITTNSALQQRYVALLARFSHSPEYETVWQQGDYALLRYRRGATTTL